MKPGHRVWSSNVNWVGGPDAGTPTKTPATDAQEADGYYRDLRVAPRTWNFDRWARDQRIAGIVSKRVLNPRVANTAALAAFADVSLDGCDGGAGAPGAHTLIAATMAPLSEEALALNGGQDWAAGAPPAGANQFPRIASDHLANRGLVVQAGAGLDVFQSAAFGAWAPWAGAPFVGCRAIHHDGVGLWAVGDGGGLLYVSTALGVALGAPTTPPAPAFAEPIAVLRHSRHPAALVWPGDTGNPIWLAMGATKIARSVDGQVWSATAAHGLGATPLDLAYSYSRKAWLVVLDNGTGAYSTDNGVTWSVPVAIGVIAAPTSARLATDGYGEWICAIADSAGGGAYEIWGSWDEALTWHFVDLPGAPAAGAGQCCAAWFGEGRFVVALASGGAPVIYVSDRAGE